MLRTFFVIVLLLFLGAIGFLVLHPVLAGLIALPISAFIATPFINGFSNYWSQRVQKAQFYEDYFRVVGRRLDKEINYAEMVDVALVKKRRRGSSSPPTHVCIETKDDGEFVIYGDPQNVDLGLDLHSWLNEKLSKSSGYEV
jgi:hypothetical protein